MANKRTYINADSELIVQGKLIIEGEFEQKQYVETQTFSESKYLGDTLIVNSDGFPPGGNTTPTVGRLQLRSGSANVFLTHDASTGTFIVSSSNVSMGNVLTVDGNLSATDLIATGNITGNFTGTAAQADALSSAVTVSLSGDVSGSQTFQNAGDTASITTTLTNSGVSAGTYGSATAIPSFAVDTKGRVTSVTNTTIAIPHTQITDFDAGARAAVSFSDAGGDGSFAYDSGTGVFTYTGPSAREVRAHFSAGTNTTYSGGL